MLDKNLNFKAYTPDMVTKRDPSKSPLVSQDGTRVLPYTPMIHKTLPMSEPERSKGNSTNMA